MKKQKVLFTASEKRGIYTLSGVFFFRMFSVFMVLPVFTLLAQDLKYSSGFWVGMAFGAYGLTQGIMQIPFGMLSDRFGRKAILILALCLFLAGSMLAAIADDIYTMFAARLLQGTGAVSAVCFALIADLTRSEVRTRANAVLGMSIGLAFGLAFPAAPFIAAWLDINGIFALSGVFGLCCLILVICAVPQQTRPANRNPVSSRQMLKAALQVRNLYPIYFGSFVCGAGLSLSLFLAPIFASEVNLSTAELWKVYLPMLFLGVLAMVPAAIYAESKNRYKQTMLCGAGALLLAGVLFTLNLPSYWALLLPLYTFFMGFNVFEPIFPSLVTKLSTPETKGTASGIFNFFQFFGHFCGASITGYFFEGNLNIAYFCFIALSICFLFSLCFFVNPNTVPKPTRAE